MDDAPSNADPRAAYQAAGVSIAAGDRLVEAIKPLAGQTHRPGTLSALGGFAALFDLQAAGHEGSLLVASTDGVGTKLRLAARLNAHHAIGVDLVAMCVNDILAQGAEPLFFLDYFATAALDPQLAATVIEGIAAGCVEAGCALVGGETAEMPGHYGAGDYDLAGFVVGAVPRDRLLPRQTIAAGDVLIALPSAGVHANGFSLVRKLINEGALDVAAPFEGATLGEALMRPTRIYVRPVLALLKADPEAILGIAHITGGGLTFNVPRMLPDALAARIERTALPALPLMDALRLAGGLDAPSMEATFNCGAGLVLAVRKGSERAVRHALEAEGERPAHIGEVVRREEGAPPCQIV